MTLPPDPSAGNPPTLPAQVSVPVPPVFATPDITPAQILAAVTAVAGQLVAWGYLDSGSAATWVSVASIILPLALALADGIIRHGRATGNALRTK